MRGAVGKLAGPLQIVYDFLSVADEMQPDGDAGAPKGPLEEVGIRGVIFRYQQVSRFTHVIVAIR